MTIEEAKSRLLNTAWIGTDEDRDKTEEAVGVLFDAVKAIEDIKQEILNRPTENPHHLWSVQDIIEVIDNHIGEVRE